MSQTKNPVVSTAPALPTVSGCVFMLESRESVSLAVRDWAKRRIMKGQIDKKELAELLEAARAAGRAEGYAQAKLEMALERAGETQSTSGADFVSEPANSPQGDLLSRAQKLETVRMAAENAQENEVYKTRTTIKMTKAIALDYLKSVAPRIVGPSEIKKNSEKDLGLFISFGTLKRAMNALVEEGAVEQLEESRWRHKPRGSEATGILRALK
jgi:hypothetical protein